MDARDGKDPTQRPGGRRTSRPRHAPLAAALLALLVLCGLFGAVTPTGASVAPGKPTAKAPKGTIATAPVPGGVLTFALQADPSGIEPLSAGADSEGAQVCQALFWGLTRSQLQPDGTLTTVPAVASSWDDNHTATVFTFHLRRGVTFAAPVSREVHAQDFVYAWNRATNPATNGGSWSSMVLAPIMGCDDGGQAPNGLTGVKALDNYTLQVTLRYPFADFPTVLTSLVAAPVPEEYIQGLGTTAAARNKAFGEKPVGDGPFVLRSWRHKHEIVLVRNPSFWDSANAANVAEIDMPIYSGSAGRAREWTDFRNGALDFAAIPRGQVRAAITAYGKSSDGYTVAPGAQVLTGPGGNMFFISFNCQKVPFDNADVRRAFSLAIDRQAIADRVSEGTATLAGDIIPPCLSGYLAGSWAYSHHDLTAAAARLATAGYPGGVGLPTITYSYQSGDPLQQALADEVKTDLEAIGAHVTLETVDPGSYWTKFGSGAFMMAPSCWYADYFSADNFLYPLFQSGQNIACTFYSNATVDADLAAARGATASGARLADYQAADAAIGQDAPAIPLYSRPNLGAGASANLGVGAASLHNGTLAPNGYFDFEGVWLTPAVVPKVTLKLGGLTSGALKLGKTVTAKGVVTPASLAGSKVTLTVQRKQGSKWLKVIGMARTISTSGAYSGTFKPAKKGSYRMEAMIAKTATHTAAITAWLGFAVK